MLILENVVSNFDVVWRSEKRKQQMLPFPVATSQGWFNQLLLFYSNTNDRKELE